MRRLKLFRLTSFLNILPKTSHIVKNNKLSRKSDADAIRSDFDAIGNDMRKIISE